MERIKFKLKRNLPKENESQPDYKVEFEAEKDYNIKEGDTISVGAWENKYNGQITTYFNLLNSHLIEYGHESNITEEDRASLLDLNDLLLDLINDHDGLSNNHLKILAVGRKAIDKILGDPPYEELKNNIDDFEFGDDDAGKIQLGSFMNSKLSNEEMDIEIVLNNTIDVTKLSEEEMNYLIRYQDSNTTPEQEKARRWLLIHFIDLLPATNGFFCIFMGELERTSELKNLLLTSPKYKCDENMINDFLWQIDKSGSLWVSKLRYLLGRIFGTLPPENPPF
ncbi:hypothetical protein V6R21_04820 [Limibacter armeniacum]|uniref:hypothetical protein n=1 Tax=Limibacter armeniacum TaxID=466084 RepID=UPI002FE60FEF